MENQDEYRVIPIKEDMQPIESNNRTWRINAPNSEDFYDCGKNEFYVHVKPRLMPFDRIEVVGDGYWAEVLVLGYTEDDESPIISEFIILRIVLFGAGDPSEQFCLGDGPVVRKND
jgi:hypothetical protein